MGRQERRVGELEGDENDFQLPELNQKSKSGSCSLLRPRMKKQTANIIFPSGNTRDSTGSLSLLLWTLSSLELVRDVLGLLLLLDLLLLLVLNNVSLGLADVLSRQVASSVLLEELDERLERPVTGVVDPLVRSRGPKLERREALDLKRLKGRDVVLLSNQKGRIQSESVTRTE